MGLFSRKTYAEKKSELLQRYDQQFRKAKTAVMPIIAAMARQQFPTYSDARVDTLSALAFAGMTFEPPLAEAASQDPDCKLLQTAALEKNSAIRRLCADASYALAKSMLLKAIDASFESYDDDSMLIGLICYGRAIRYGKADDLAMYLAGASELLFSWKRWDAAYAYANRALEMQPKNTQALRIKGLSAYATGHLGEAKELLQRTESLKPGLEGVRKSLDMLKAHPQFGDVIPSDALPPIRNDRFSQPIASAQQEAFSAVDEILLSKTRAL